MYTAEPCTQHRSHGSRQVSIWQSQHPADSGERLLHLQKLQQRALEGEYDRQIDFGRGGGLWVVRLSTYAVSFDSCARMATCRRSGLFVLTQGPLCLCRSMEGARHSHRLGTECRSSILCQPKQVLHVYSRPAYAWQALSSCAVSFSFHCGAQRLGLQGP